MSNQSRTMWHHGALVFAVASAVFMMGSGSIPSPSGCMVEVYDCREVNGFCVAQSVPSSPNGQPPSDPTKRLRICDNGLRSANHAESGFTYASPYQTRQRVCYCFTTTYIAACDWVPTPGIIKLPSCGTNGHGQCCFGEGKAFCETLHNSSQGVLSSTSCSGFNPANP